MKRLSELPPQDATTLGNWLAQFSASVRNRDFTAARTLFEQDVVAFGTVADLANGLQQLERQQWEVVWLHSADFAFAAEPWALLGAHGQCAVVASLWTSIGYDAQGVAFPRAGRATIVLLRTGPAAPWRATHSHFSLAPSSHS